MKNKKFLTLFIAISVCMLLILSMAYCTEGEKPPVETDEGTDTPVEFAFEESYYTVAEDGKLTLVLNGVAEGKTVTWSSDDTSVATVDSGVVTGIKSGTTLIRATVDDAYVICSVTVTPYEPLPALSLSLNTNEISIYAGDSYQLYASLTLGGESVEAESITYASTDESVATVSDGKIVAVKNGKTDIIVTATYKESSATAAVEVSVVDSSIVFAPDFSVREMKAGEELDLKVVVMNGKQSLSSDGINLNWSVDGNNGKVKIEDGKLIALKKGKIALKASAVIDGKTYSFSIPFRIREEYTVTFTAEGNVISEQKVLDGELITLPSEPTLKGRIFGGWFSGTARFDATAKIQKDYDLKAHWLVDGKGYTSSSKLIAFHKYSSLGELETNILYFNDTFPNGNLSLHPQDKLGAYYITLPAIDFTKAEFAPYDEIAFTISYNYGDLAVKMNEIDLVTMDAGKAYILRAVKIEGGFDVYLDEQKVASMNNGDKLKFSFNIPDTDIYAQFDISAMCYFRLDYMTHAQKILASIPEDITAQNFASYTDELEEYERMIGYYTEYEMSVYAEPSRITALKGFINN